MICIHNVFLSGINDITKILLLGHLYNAYEYISDWFGQRLFDEVSFERKFQSYSHLFCINILFLAQLYCYSVNSVNFNLIFLYSNVLQGVKSTQDQKNEVSYLH